MAYTKKNTVNQEPIIESKEVEEKPVVLEKEIVPVQTAKEFKPNDLIDVRSVTQGVLVFNGIKSLNNYTWSGYGDSNPVEYQDLLSDLISGGTFILKPYFVIENEDLLNLPRWKEVKELYEKMYAPEDINEILNIDDINEFERVLSSSPTGLRNAIKNAASDAVYHGTFDSIRKVKIIDKVCGTEISKLMFE